MESGIDFDDEINLKNLPNGNILKIKTFHPDFVEISFLCERIKTPSL
jgi:hypothetical protein